MFNFFKEYFNCSHRNEGYLVPKVNGLTKVSKKERMIWIIASYVIIFFSFFVFFLPLDLIQNLFLWVIIVMIPIFEIYNFDFRIFKIIRLYLYSRSKNANKKIIYEAYMIDNYHKLIRKMFDNYKKKRILINNSSFKYHVDCFWENMKLSITIKPSKLIIKINGNKEVIKNNKKDFCCILRTICEKISD